MFSTSSSGGLPPSAFRGTAVPPGPAFFLACDALYIFANEVVEQVLLTALERSDLRFPTGFVSQPDFLFYLRRPFFRSVPVRVAWVGADCLDVLKERLCCSR